MKNRIMWKLSIDSSLEAEYLAKFQGKLVEGILNGKGSNKLSKRIQKILIEDYNATKPVKLNNVIKLLIGKPKEAFDLNNKLMKKIFPDYDVNNLGNLKPHKNILKTIEKIFNYNGVISGDKDNSYWLAHRIGHNTCTYCNRQYTFTLGSDDTSVKITRPQFDHWFPKELFPLLSLNLYNLIPSCSICNSSIKGAVVFNLATHIHPYLQSDDEPRFSFSPVVSTDSERDWDVCLNRKDGSKEDNTIKAFKLDEMYNAHGDLEVKDLMDFATGYTDNYLRDLYKNILSNFTAKGYTQEEVFRIVFGVEYLSEKTLDRPLSKLKRDILKYLNVIS